MTSRPVAPVIPGASPGRQCSHRAALGGNFRSRRCRPARRVVCRRRARPTISFGATMPVAVLPCSGTVARDYIMGSWDKGVAVVVTC